MTARRLAVIGSDSVGAVGDPDIPDRITLPELRIAKCQGLEQHANLWPTRLPGEAKPSGRLMDAREIITATGPHSADAGGQAQAGTLRDALLALLDQSKE